jgi:hypothetical protein
VAECVPDSVRWRPGKQHLGPSFIAAFLDLTRDRARSSLQLQGSRLTAYVDVDRLAEVKRRYFGGQTTNFDDVYGILQAAELAAWLARFSGR